jgi:protein TonB
VPSNEVNRHLGSAAVLCGDVLAVRQTPGKPPGALEFDVGQPAGAPDFTVVIPKASRGKFSTAFDRYIDRRQVCVEGPPAQASGLPSLEIKDVTGFRFMGALPPPPRGFAEGVLDMYHLRGTPGVVVPKLLRGVDPKYTTESMRTRVKGNVEVEVVVGVDGLVSNLWPTVSLDPFLGLDDSAIDAARQWKFAPGTVDGHPVPMKVALVLAFDLHSPQPDDAVARPSLEPVIVPIGFDGWPPSYPVPLQVGQSEVVSERASSFVADDPFGQGATPVTRTNVASPIVRTRVAPQYPLDALRENVQGTVFVEAIVGTDGNVTRTRPGQSFPGCLPSLEAEAQRSVQRWTFWPGQVDGKPGAVWIRVSVPFRLRR